MMEPSTLKRPSVAPKVERGYALAASDCRLLSVEGWLPLLEVESAGDTHRPPTVLMFCERSQPPATHRCAVRATYGTIDSTATYVRHNDNRERATLGQGPKMQK